MVFDLRIVGTFNSNDTNIIASKDNPSASPSQAPAGNHGNNPI